jgi:hypothetical protein
MKQVNWALSLGIMALVAVLCAATANADLYVETENVSTNIPHQPNGATTLKNYFTSKASRVELGNGKVFILDYGAMKMFTLDPKAKTYAEHNLGELEAAAPDMSGSDKQQILNEAMAAILAVQVHPTDETKIIEGYRCRKFNVNVAMVKGEYWVSKDVKGYQELRTLGAKVASVLDRNPMLRQFNIAGMAEKLDGFPVYIVNHVLGGTVQTTLKDVKQRPLEPALFRVPKDYTLAGNK